LTEPTPLLPAVPEPPVSQVITRKSIVVAGIVITVVTALASLMLVWAFSRLTRIRE